MNYALFDFSGVSAGDVITHVFYGEFDQARVIAVTGMYIICDIKLYTGGPVVFNRGTGVDVKGPRFGFLMNKPFRPGDEDFAREAEGDLLDCLTTYQSLIPEPARKAILASLTY